MERAVPFKFQSPSSILIAEPSGCGKTCFTESFLVHHLSDLFAQPPTAIVYCYGAWQEKFDRMKHNGDKISQRSPDVSHLQKWFTAKGGIIKMEKNHDYWYKRAMDLEKKVYCKQCLSRQKEVEDLNDVETMELCAECAERLRSTMDMQERLKFLETQIKQQNSSAFENTRYLTLLYKIHC